MKIRDRLFRVTVRRFWFRWKDALIIVKPDTVVPWHRTAFRYYWRSRPCSGPPKISQEIRDMIRRIARDNVGWDAPKIHGELLKLGCEVSERTVARYLRRVHRRRGRSNSWLTFLQTIVK